MIACRFVVQRYVPAGHFRRSIDAVHSKNEQSWRLNCVLFLSPGLLCLVLIEMMQPFDLNRRFRSMKCCLLASLLCMAPMLHAQSIEWIKPDRIQEWKSPANDTVYVLNFWATWCAPCVAELPVFEQMQAKFANQKVKIILISTDFKRDANTRLPEFVQKKQLQCKVVLMEESNPNRYIDQVSTEWSGAIPATLIIRPSTGFERFYEKQIDADLLEKNILNALK